MTRVYCSVWTGSSKFVCHVIDTKWTRRGARWIMSMRTYSDSTEAFTTTNIYFHFILVNFELAQAAMNGNNWSFN
jgi:hypothetical protein